MSDSLIEVSSLSNNSLSIFSNSISSKSLTANNSSFNLQQTLDKSYDIIILITTTEYNDMLQLFYNSSSSLVNYNDNYFILQIKPYLKFNTNHNNILQLQNIFKNITK